MAHKAKSRTIKQRPSDNPSKARAGKRDNPQGGRGGGAAARVEVPAKKGRR